MTSSDLAHPNSHVPGLTLSPEEEESRRKNYIRESDSEYVKLAKQGGIKDLLSIESNSNEPKEAVAYPKSDWFGHHSMESEDQEKILAERKWRAPDYMTYSMSEGDKVHGKAPASQYSEKPRELTAREERLLIQAKYNSREVPYQTDNMSCWERKEEAPLRSRLRK